MLMLVLTLLVTSSVAFPNGAPKRVCRRLTPGHKDIDYIRSATTATLYAEKVTPGKYLVKINATQPFKGFIIQGRKNDEEALGVFQPPKRTDQYQLLNCFKVNGNTITHTTPESKNEIMAEWIVDPLNFEGGFLYGVVVYNYTTVQKLAFDL